MKFMKQGNNRFYRISLGILLLFIALNAFGGGYYGLSGAKDIPSQWLEGSPFQNYFLPSLFLLVIIGGTALVAGILVLRKKRMAKIAALTSGLLLVFWISVQVLIIGYVSWMQPAIAIAAVLIIFLSLKFSVNAP